MKSNPTRYSSAVGEVWVMATFKAKYCHKIFDVKAVRELTKVLFFEAFDMYCVSCKKISFDSDHVHMILDLGLYSKPVLAKKLKGYVGRSLLRMLPWLKRSKFWGSGLWNPPYDIRSISDMDFYRRYLEKQRYAYEGQKQLMAYV